MQTVKAQLPIGALLNENDRLDYHAKADKVQALVQIGKLAFARKLQRITVRTRIEITYCFPAEDQRGRSQAGKRRDVANWAPTSKALVDGLVRAGIMPDDNGAWVVGPFNLTGPPIPNRNMVEVWITLDDAPAIEPAEKRAKGPSARPMCGHYISQHLAVAGREVRYHCTEEPHDAKVKHHAVTADGDLRW